MSFHPAGLVRRYAFLDRCPDTLFEAIVPLRVGTLEERVSGVLAWREALLRGELPPEGDWPPPHLARPARAALESIEVARFCRDQPELVDALLLDLLRAFARRHKAVLQDIAARLRELERLERERLKAKDRKDRVIDPKTLHRLREQARKRAEAATSTADVKLLQIWEPRARAWAAIHDVFDDLGSLLGRGWDLSIGVLRRTGWADLVRLRALVESLPQLKAIIESLGRLQQATDGECITQTVFQAMTRIEEELREVPTPLVPAETRGVERSGDIARMLPSEAAALGHPVLRMVWHARRAERALMAYRIEGTEIESHQVEVTHQQAHIEQAPRPKRGPIIALLDTSGSMHGLPEKVAKALVLEALRTAHKESRDCLVFAYSGPGQVLEHQLHVSDQGIGTLLDFLALSFGGGNDEVGVLDQLLDRLEAEQWQKADVLFVSDGEWPDPVQIYDKLEKAREAGTRFHGVQIGNRGRTGLHAVCDPVHVFADWAAVTGG